MAKIVALKQTIKEATVAEEKEDISLTIKENEEAIKINSLAEKLMTD